MRIITDSAADMPAEEARALGVKVAPLYIIFPDGEIEASDITPDAFYERLEAMQPELPTTAQPSAGVFTQMYREAAQTDDEILSIHISSGLSGTVNSAELAAAELKTEANVQVVDSLTLSGGQRFQVLAAIRALEAGWDKKALLGWYIIDEPHATREALDDYLWAREAINKVDPDHPVTTGGNKYNIFFDRHRPVVIFDRYPLREHSQSPWSIANITRHVYRDANGPVWYIAPAFHNISGEYPRPTPAQFRLMCYAAVANGAKGIFLLLPPPATR